MGHLYKTCLHCRCIIIKNHNFFRADVTCWFLAGLAYNPTSVMFINIPSISKLQWHPFTITSNSNLEPEQLSVVIKSEGTWSQELYHMLSTPSAVGHINVSVEGPYGPATTNYLRSVYILETKMQIYSKIGSLTFNFI